MIFIIVWPEKCKLSLCPAKPLKEGLKNIVKHCTTQCRFCLNAPRINVASMDIFGKKAFLKGGTEVGFTDRRKKGRKVGTKKGGKKDRKENGKSLICTLHFIKEGQGKSSAGMDRHVQKPVYNMKIQEFTNTIPGNNPLLRNFELFV